MVLSHREKGGSSSSETEMPLSAKRPRSKQQLAPKIYRCGRRLFLSTWVMYLNNGEFPSPINYHLPLSTKDRSTRRMWWVRYFLFRTKKTFIENIFSPKANINLHRHRPLIPKQSTLWLASRYIRSIHTGNPAAWDIVNVPCRQYQIHFRLSILNFQLWNSNSFGNYCVRRVIYRWEVGLSQIPPEYQTSAELCLFYLVHSFSKLLHHDLLSRCNIQTNW